MNNQSHSFRASRLQLPRCTALCRNRDERTDDSVSPFKTAKSPHNNSTNFHTLTLQEFPPYLSGFQSVLSYCANTLRRKCSHIRTIISEPAPTRFWRWIIAWSLLIGHWSFRPASAADRSSLEHEFTEHAEPFLRTYCFRCHGKDENKLRGDFDLRGLLTFEGFMNDEHRSMMLLDQVSAGQMPPEDAPRTPTPEDRSAFTNWVHQVYRYIGEKNAGDPGTVLARRLSNSEYDYTIRDLTGFDLRPTREFPVDPANEAGFDNTGESLTMSPALVKKYLDAARDVASHLVLKPDGLAFASHPMIVDTDRDKYCVRRIIDFYQGVSTNYGDYYFTLWKARQSTTPLSDSELAKLAAEKKLSVPYLKTLLVVSASRTAGDLVELGGAYRTFGPMAAVQKLFGKILSLKDESTARVKCDELGRFIVDLRSRVQVDVGNLRMNSANPGTQALVLWKDREMAANRRAYCGGGLTLKYAEFVKDPDAFAALTPPEDEPARRNFESEFERFCSIFPDAFVVSERARIFENAKEDKDNVGRFLSAGFHNQFGYFRDDRPMCDLLLDDAQKRELDKLWQELDFIALAPLRQHSSSIWFDRAEAGFLREPQFDPFRAEDKDCASPEKYRKYQEVYMEKVRRNTQSEGTIKAFEDHFRILENSIRWVETAHLAAEPAHFSALAHLAERAYRRPLASDERNDLIAFYKSLRSESGLDHEEAVRECFVSILMSPSFCYRTDSAGSGPNVQPLDDYSLANRLSYFLWSSMPDEELLKHAAGGNLHHRDVLLAQTRRLIKDSRVRALATEFGGNWLDFRRFEEHNAVDRERFKTFNNDLRQAMFEEPIRLLNHIFQSNQPIIDLVFADYTFVNPVLAAHYGFPSLGVGSNTWVRFDHADRYKRGGILPMAVFLTKNAPGLRTSPVKRGYWVVRKVLGEHIPPPPPKVPELPSDESKLQLSLRDTLARHREDHSCAACHARFDSFGLVFEGFGPVGDRRTLDLAGRQVDTGAPFPDGSERQGLEGLRQYIREYRQRDFVDTFSRKLLAFALGRNLRLSDELLVEEMRANLEKNGYTFNNAVETIVTSSQFLNRRTQRDLTAN